MGHFRLFVSHAHQDKEIAAALVGVIEAAMVRRDDEGILCTSHDDPQYREPGGVDVTRYLRDHLQQSGCVLGVLTPNSLRSPWCLFELGGAWALTTRTYPLLAGGLAKDDLPAALKGGDAARLAEPGEIRLVLEDVCRALGWEPRGTGSAENEITRLVELVRGRTWASTPPPSDAGVGSPPAGRP